MSKAKQNKDFSVYMKILKESSSFTNLVEFVYSFLETFDLKLKESMEDAIKSWVYKNSQGYRRYFSNITLSSEAIKSCLEFLEESINVRFKQVQKDFIGYADMYPYIDYETSDQTQFFNSVVNQFLVIVKYPIVDITPPDAESNVQKTVSQSVNICDKMKEALNDIVVEGKLSYYLNKVMEFLEGDRDGADGVLKICSAISDGILNRYMNYCNEEIYQKISELNVSIKSYGTFVGLVYPVIAKHYSNCWTKAVTFDDIQNLLDIECTKIKETPPEDGKFVFSSKPQIPIEYQYPLYPYLVDWENVLDPEFASYKPQEILTQLGHIKTVFGSLDKVASLYYEIFGCYPIYHE